MAAVLAGCAGMDPAPRPAEGFPAIRFEERVAFPVALGTIHLGAGSTLVADQTRGGRPVYCGPGSIRDLATQAMEVCLLYDGTMLTLASDRTGRNRWPAPAAMREIRLR